MTNISDTPTPTTTPIGIEDMDLTPEACPMPRHPSRTLTALSTQETARTLAPSGRKRGMRPVMAEEPRPMPSGLLVDHLQDLVLKTEDVKAMLDELAEFSALTLSDPAVAFCSITLMQRKKPVTVASSEERASGWRNPIQQRRRALPDSDP